MGVKVVLECDNQTVHASYIYIYIFHYSCIHVMVHAYVIQGLLAIGREDEVMLESNA